MSNCGRERGEEKNSVRQREWGIRDRGEIKREREKMDGRER